MPLAWGDAAVMETLINQMAAGEGLGRILAQGVRRAAETIGKGAHRYAAHVKGLELTAYHPAAILGSALGYAVSSRGGDYNNVYASLEHRWPAEKGPMRSGLPNRWTPKDRRAKGGWCAGPCW
jgi:aldehyde:ferredoxin oxidoreductase